ncbi:MAG: copper chaperone PCu(A)C [Gammaproteobacteria bacterium]
MTNIFVLVGLLVVNPAVAAEGPLLLDNFWIRESPPASQVLAGYGRIHNSSSNPYVLTGATSETFNRIEIHRTTILADIVRMAPQHKILIKPGESLVFEPNSYHFMLLGPNSRLQAGDIVTLTLQFDNGVNQEVAMRVRSASEIEE